MHRLAALAAALVLVVTACGAGDSGQKQAGGAAPSTPRASPSATAYFRADDTASINKVAGAAQKVAARARANASIDRCNRQRSKGYAPWRACLHGYLDPAEQSLYVLADHMKELATHDLPASCVASLRRAGDTFAGFAAQVAALSKGIDSDKRAAQAKAVHTYAATLDKIAAGYTKPFQDLTQVCYSPKDLASINASPSASPGS